MTETARKTRPRPGVQRITFDAPDYIIEHLKTIAAERGTTLRFLMLKAIEKHYEIPLQPGDSVGDNRLFAQEARKRA